MRGWGRKGRGKRDTVFPSPQSSLAPRAAYLPPGPVHRLFEYINYRSVSVVVFSLANHFITSKFV